MTLIVPFVGNISVVILIRTDTTLDHSQKAEKVCCVSGHWISHPDANLMEHTALLQSVESCFIDSRLRLATRAMLERNFHGTQKLAAPEGAPERSPSSVLTGPCDG